MTSKPCNNCHNTKDLDDFYHHKGCKDGHAHTCKQCVNDKQKADRAANPEKYRKYQETYNTKHPTWRAEYRKNNVKKIKAYGKRYRAENKEEIKATQLAYYNEQMEKRNYDTI